MRDLDGRLRDLEHRLVDERTSLLGAIKVPELGAIHSRARGLRRRRRMVGAAAALTLLSIVGAGTAVALDNRAVRPPDVAASGTPTPTSTQSIYRGAGLIMYGLSAPVDDRPGAIYDIQFADAERGYMLMSDCPAGGDVCAVAALATSNAGRSWHALSLPLTSAPATSRPRLVPLGTEQVGLIGGTLAWIWTPGTWESLNAASPPPVASVPKGGRLWTRAGDGCDSGPLYVWGMNGTLGVLATPPPMQVCRVMAGPGGAWWVGGYDNAAGRRPVVAVSRDAGRSWRTFPLPAAGGDAWAQVSPLGTEVYASVVSPRGGQPYPQTVTLHAVYRSAEGGPFQRYGPTNSAIVGDVIPLLDGRLLAAGPGWYVSAEGDPFRKVGGSMPFVGHLARSPGGWIAYDLFQAGYAAVSRDGSEWHKFNIR
jgi:hypothetical protein